MTDSIKRKVLVVDDAQVNRAMISGLLTTENYEVNEAETGESAVQQCLATAYDIILMDVNLPGIDGTEATRRIRASSNSPSAGATIIGISAHASQRDRNKFQEAGMDDCLPKPIDLKRLISMLEGASTLGFTGGECSETRDQAHCNRILDVDAALRRIGSNHDLFRRFVQMFRNDIGGLLHDSTKAIQATELSKLGDIAHRIRGMSANLSANAVSQIASALEESCAQGDAKLSIETFDILKSEIEILENEFAIRGFVE